MTNTQSGSSTSGKPESGNVGGNRQHDQGMDDRKRGTQQPQHGDRSQPDADKPQRGGSGNFANDRDKASEAGRKGGQHSHGGSSK